MTIATASRHDGRPPAGRSVRPLLPSAAAETVAILTEATAWSSRLGDAVWRPGDFSEAEQARRALAGELIGGFDGDELVACMNLQSTDELFWPDDRRGEALYVHKIAVKRVASGTGWLSCLLDFATSEALARGAAMLRLDTLPRAAMLAMYTSRGFQAVDAEPKRFGDRWMIRLEKPVG